MTRLISSLAVALVAAACGGSSTAANTPSPTPKIIFTMGTMNASGVAGTGEVVKSASSFTVTIKLTGLAPGSMHVSHIHLGSCAKPGGIKYALQEVIADSSGKATTTSSVAADYSTLPTGGWYVNVHKGPDLSVPANGPSITCGDLPVA